MAAFVATGAALELAEAVRAEVLQLLFNKFGAAWAADPAAPSAEPAAIEHARHQAALPVLAGAMEALAAFTWDTAPPGATIFGLDETLEGNALLACSKCVTAGPSGSFWTHVAQKAARP